MDARRDEGIATAKALSERLTGGVDPKLIGYFALAEETPILLTPDKPKKGVLRDASLPQTTKDLQDLGLDLDFPEIEQVEINLDMLSEILPVLRIKIEQVMKDSSIHLSRKELNLLLQLDIPNAEARSILLDLFFTENSLRRGPTNILDSIEALNKILHEDNESFIPRVVREVETRDDGVREIKTRPRFTDNEIRFIQARSKHMENYVQSNFAFLMFKLALLPENAAWIMEPDNHEMHVPSDIAKQFGQLEAICIDNGFFMYTSYVEESLRAFMRVYLGVYNDSALRDIRGITKSRNPGKLRLLLEEIGIIRRAK